ncbi:uncharacterized protein DUF2784 [Kribbella amoyensis]|uniref:Uncharacterized protein DUF2784 n=1 Tax=Kribbella amoyensis TaxID=996641 RepID=A0A561BNX5_9ACTN|nr:DUF2784 domain-containing protein [Kribbella amoyensis]TWD80578.1 uncharacterized protein DUF2784 [Kribbella amoyensis]
MVFRFLADVVMVLHGAMLVFFVIGGFLAWKWRWLIWVHLFIVFWNLVIVLLDFGCPVTALEKFFRREGGEQPYVGGYIAHYLDGPVWPVGGTPWAERIGFTLVVISYIGFFVTGRRQRERVTTGV